MSRILVTGGAGAIGSNLVRLLVGDGHGVSVLDDLSSGRREFLPADVTFHQGSVADPAALERSFGEHPDYVIHLAALFANQNSVEHPAKDLEVNALGTLRVLEMAHRRGVRKVAYTSSSCVYGSLAEMPETVSSAHLDTPYAITKLVGEHYAHFFSHQYGLPVVCLRLFNSYGPGELPGPYRNVIPNFFGRALRGQPLVITGTGHETRDFTFVGDTCRGIVGALLADTGAFNIFNLSSGRETRILELAEKINVLTRNTAGIEFAPRRSWDTITRRLGPNEKATRAFDYRAETSLDEGLTRTAAWMEEVRGLIV